MIAYLDTHIAAWLYAGLTERLSLAAKRKIEECDLLISPMVLLELQYLFDRKRVSVEPVPLCTYLRVTFGVEICSYPFPAVALAALSNSWTTDPFDRLIVAHAIASGNSVLITADTHIRKHYAASVW